MLAACEGCSEERRARCAARQQTWAMGTVAGGIIDGEALGEVRGRQFAGAANTCGVTPCWPAAVVAWALLSIIGTLGCHWG